MIHIAERLFKLFRGLSRAHGIFEIQGRSPSGKMQGRARTVYEQVTVDKWLSHIKGKQGIGIVPINDANECVWALLDIDVYDLDLYALEQRIIENKLPLTVFRTKSGGAHLTLFLKEPAPAVTVREKLVEWSAQLGFAGCEVFPKQEKLVGKEDVGNWVNMPLFGGEDTDRYVIKDRDSLGLEDAVALCESRRVSVETMIAAGDSGENVFEGMPPCLDLLTRKGFPEGVRNDSLFSLGVYCRLRYPDEWAKQLEDMNRSFMQPPLPAAEVTALIKSLERKDYFYRCDTPPLKNHCNKSKCYTCAYGVGGSGQGAAVTLSDLHKIMTEPPIWLLVVDGKRMRLSTAQLANQQQFAVRCMEALSVVPRTMKATEWKNELSRLMLEDNGYKEIPMPDDVTPAGLLSDLLHEYCESGSRRTVERKHLLVGNRVWYDEANSVACFRGSGFLAFLERKNFKEMKTHEITATMRTRFDCESKKRSIEGKSINLWHVKMDVSKGELTIPEHEEDF